MRLYSTLEGCCITLLNGSIRRNEDQKLTAVGERKGRPAHGGNRGYCKNQNVGEEMEELFFFNFLIFFFFLVKFLFLQKLKKNARYSKRTKHSGLNITHRSNTVIQVWLISPNNLGFPAVVLFALVNFYPLRDIQGLLISQSQESHEQAILLSDKWDLWTFFEFRLRFS